MQPRHGLRRVLMTRSYVGLTVTWVLWRIGTLAAGLLLQSVFDRLTNRATGVSVAAMIGILAAVEGARLIMQFPVILARFEPSFQYATMSLLRANLIRSIFHRPGIGVGGDDSTGQTLSKFGDDVNEIGRFAIWSPVNIARWTFAGAAIVIMVRIDTLITLAVMAPLAIAVAVSKIMNQRLMNLRRDVRRSAADVSAAINEAFAGVEAIKVAQAEKRIVEHIAELGRRRRRGAVKESLTAAVQGSLFSQASGIGTGLVLLLASESLRSGSFTVGNLVLFTFYLQFLVDTVTVLGMFIVRLQRARVSMERLSGAAGTTTALLDAPPENGTEALNTIGSLNRLQVRGLTYRFAGTDKGIQSVSFDIKSGTVTIVTGRVGSGKTTLLRTLLGLLPRDRGEIIWNENSIKDPAKFLIPPRCAYTPQTPHLFSGSVGDNILLGLIEDVDAMSAAVEMAVLKEDISAMPQGLATILGPRGVRLSGGQIQRVAAARMFVRQPELLVMDDVSSALDIETEQILWEQLFTRYIGTVLAVSHRPTALRRADQVIVMDAGRVAAIGKLDELLRTSPIMRDLYAHPQH